MPVCAVGARGTASKRNGHCQAEHCRHPENGHVHVRKVDSRLPADQDHRRMRGQNVAYQLFFTDYGASSLFKEEHSH